MSPLLCTISRKPRAAFRRSTAYAMAALVAFMPMAPSVAFAQDDLAAQVARLSAQIAAQEARLDDQERAIVEQNNLLEAQRLRLAHQARIAPPPAADLPIDLGAMRGAGPAGAHGIILLGQASTVEAAPTVRPVGEAPPAPTEPPPQVAALPEGAGVLTPKGRLSLEPSYEYTRSSNNRLVYRGVEIVTGIQVGLLEANDADRDTVVGAISARYGLTKRIEIEGRIPYVYRFDRILTVAQSNTSVSRQQELDGQDIGDVEASMRYQINRPRNGGPAFVAGLKVKGDTGSGPYEIKRDSAGVAEELATGSGFTSGAVSLSMLLPSDPAVIFANVNYLGTLAKNVDRQVGQAFVGRVVPGASIGGGVGFGFALNQRFSYSLGYSHSYITGTKSVISNTRQESSDLHVGSMSFGMSYRVTPRVSLAGNVELGATNDAPDSRVTLRVPISLDLNRKKK
jgi:hypothetical protein